VDHAQGGGQGRSFRTWRIAVPFAVGTFPEKVPDILAANIGHLGNGLLGVFAGAIKGRAYVEKLDGLILKALPLADFVAQMQWRTVVHPKMFFEGDRMICYFGIGKGHMEKSKLWALNAARQAIRIATRSLYG